MLKWAIIFAIIAVIAGALGFGGVGMSGRGRHHGIEGFREFSNPRGTVLRGGDGDHIDAFFSPYAKAASIADGLLGPV